MIEVAARRWASGIGVPTPAILAHDPAGEWLLGERIEAAEPVGAGYVDEALRCADLIAEAEPPALPARASQWRASRWTLLPRTARMVAAGISPLDFRARRSAAAALSTAAVGHGDFYRRNVLATGQQGGVSVIDWEFIGPGPLLADHVRFWSTLRREQDRQRAWDGLRDRARDLPDPQHLSDLVQWLALRLLAENLAAPPRQRDPQDLRHARLVHRQARDLTAAGR